MSMEPGPEQFAWTLEQSFVRVIPDQVAAVQKAITMLRERHPGRPVVLLNESAFLGSLPLKKGARGAKPDGIIGIGINPVSLSSVDTAPYGTGLPPPTSPSYVLYQFHFILNTNDPSGVFSLPGYHDAHILCAVKLLITQN